MIKPRVLIVCERSQVEQQAFSAAGAYAFSLDILPCYGPDPSHHIIADAYDFPLTGWDLIVAHPPCTDLTHANNARRNSPGRVSPVVRALRLWARFLFESPCPVCVENPVGIPNEILSPSQIICPSDFGEPYKKRTCLWLRGLPPLLSTCTVLSAVPWIDSHSYTGASSRALPGVPRPVARSQSFAGVATAMASQWLPYVCPGFVVPGWESFKPLAPVGGVSIVPKEKTRLADGERNAESENKAKTERETNKPETGVKKARPVKRFSLFHGGSK